MVMSGIVIFFFICVFLVELALIYSPLYYVCYCLFGLDKKVGDAKLFPVLMTITVLLSAIFLKSAANLVYYLIT